VIGFSLRANVAVHAIMTDVALDLTALSLTGLVLLAVALAASYPW
jgi:hypothetical protein